MRAAVNLPSTLSFFVYAGAVKPRTRWGPSCSSWKTGHNDIVARSAIGGGGKMGPWPAIGGGLRGSQVGRLIYEVFFAMIVVLPFLSHWHGDDKGRGANRRVSPSMMIANPGPHPRGCGPNATLHTSKLPGRRSPLRIGLQGKGPRKNSGKRHRPFWKNFASHWSLRPQVGLVSIVRCALANSIWKQEPARKRGWGPSGDWAGAHEHRL